MKKIADGIAMLDLTMDAHGHQMVIHPTLLWDDEQVILVDTGMPGQLAAIQSEMAQAGVAFSRLTKVILTHQDMDHIGGLPDILNAAKDPIEVLAHELDKPYIEGEKRMIKSAPDATVPTATVQRTLADGEVLPYFGGLSVIFTPGHTPGHISLYHQPTKTLITGDAIVSEDGRLLGPNEQFTPDLPEALRSIKKFADFDVDTAICYHGGLCTDGVNAFFAGFEPRA